MNPPKISRIVVVVKENSTKVSEEAHKIIDKLVSFGFNIYTISPFEHSSCTKVSSLKEVKRTRVQLVITIGGDGTILKVFRELNDKTPILGVNVGGRGILTEITPKEFPKMLIKLENGNYFLDCRSRISCSVSSQVYPPALNEIYLIRVPLNNTPTYTLNIGNSFTLSQRMDGIIVASSTGSTGHSLSLGGPVIDEKSDNFLFTPIGPVSRIPPIVSSSKMAELIPSMEAKIIIDGQESYVIKGGTHVNVTQHNINAYFIRFTNRNLRQLHNLGFT